MPNTLLFCCYIGEYILDIMASSVSYQRKRALIIGINDYSRDPLQYCINDAEDLNATLQRIDFDTSLGVDCNLQEFYYKVDTFAKTIERNDIVFILFCWSW